METIIIRNIREEDIPNAVDIQISGWKSAYTGMIDDDFLNSLDRDKKIEQRRKDYKQDGYIVAEKNKEIVGFCRYLDYNDDTSGMLAADCEIKALYVKPDFKYNGTGTQMFQFVVEEFKRKNRHKMIIWCLKDNEPSKMFYTKMGGKIAQEKVIELGEKNYIEVGFLYNI